MRPAKGVHVSRIVRTLEALGQLLGTFETPLVLSKIDEQMRKIVGSKIIGRVALDQIAVGCNRLVGLAGNAIGLG